MTRLIDADRLEDDCNLYDKWDAQIVKEWLKDQPTIDAVPVEYILKQIAKLERSKGQSYHAICYRHLIEVWEMENEREEE